MQVTREVHRDLGLPEHTRLAPGSMVDHFRVLRPLGHGGEGVVYLARDTLLGRKVALKLLRQRDPKAQEQLLVEAQATARFSHPHIVTIYAVGTYQERPYLALEYLEGPSLRSRISERSIAPREAMRIGAAVAEALAEAHRNGVLHRDLKPENVIIPWDGRLRVLDFGLAAASGGTTSDDDPLRGTPAYLAPEQWHGEPACEASDLWALGVLLHEMAAGIRPYADPGDIQLLFAEVTSPVPVPRLETIPAPLAELIGRCLVKAPADRPPAREVAERLRELLAAERPSGAPLEASPFRGLEPFTERHAALFFGRERELAAFLERLRESTVLPIVGPSGAGKSSFVHAGVVPRLREQGRWAVLALRPGSDPFRTLAARLETAGRGEGELATEDRPLERATASEAELAESLRESPAQLAPILERLASELGSRILLVVDQLEELATHVEEEGTRRAFMQAICGAADDVQGPVRVIFTLREDFLSRLALTSQLRRVLGQVTLIGMPDEAALEEILTAPLRERGYAYEDQELVREMIEATGRFATALPLLEFTAHLLWEKRDAAKRKLTRAALGAIGGVAGALASHADGVIEGLASADEACARELLLRLVTAERLRRVVPVPELLTGLPPSAEAVLGQLVRARLVSTRKSRGADGAAVAELIHESLVRNWGRLARWIDRSREDLAFLEEAGQAAEVWERRGRRPDDLWHGETLRDGRRALQRCTALTVPDLVRAFLSAGERRERRRLRGQRTMIASVIVVLVALVAVLATQKEQADRQRIETRLRWAEAQREGGRAALARGDLLEARAKLRGAFETRDSLDARTLWRRLEREPLIWSRSFAGPVFSIAFSPDGRTLLAATPGGVVALDVETRSLRTLHSAVDRVLRIAVAPRGAVGLGTWEGEVLLTDLAATASRRLASHRGPVWALTISPDGKRLASGGSDGRVLVVALDDRGSRPLEIAAGAPVQAISFVEGGLLVAASPELQRWALDCSRTTCAARRLSTTNEGSCGISSLASDPRATRTAIGCMGREVRVRDGARRFSLRGHTDSVTAVVLGRDGARLASADQSGRILLWVAGKLGLRIDAHPGRIRMLATSPDGRTLASCADDGAVRLWSLDGRQGTPLARGHEGPVESVLFLSDSELASVGADGYLRLWDARSSEHRAVVVSTEGLVDIAASPDAAQLAIAGEPDAVWTWRPARQRLRRLATHSNPRAVAFSPAGSLASAGNDAAIRLWDPASGERKASLDNSGTVVDGLAFDAVGSSLAVARHDGAIWVWDLATGKVSRVLKGHEGAVHAVAWDREGTTIASSSADGTIRLWDERGAGRIVDRVLGRTYRLAFHPKNPDLLGVGTSLGSALLLELATGKRRWLRGHRGDVNAIRFSPDGALAASVGDDGTVRLFEVATGKPAWRGPALLSAPPRLLSHLGWRRLDGQAPNAAPASSSWRRALEERAAHADQAPDRQTICLRTAEDQLEIWDQTSDRRLHAETIPGLRDPVALEEGCLALDAREARLYHRASLVRRLAATAAARDRERGRVLVVSGDQVLVLDTSTGVEAERRRIAWRPSAVARVASTFALGFEDGRLELVGRAITFEQTPASPVRRVVEGPRGTLAAGYANGQIGLWHLETGARLDAVKLHGPIAHLLLEKDAIHAATELGDSEKIDLSILSLDYCTLVRRIQREVPVVWEGGQPVVRAPTPVPGCANRP